MIRMFEYTRDEVDFLYSEVERACANKGEHINISVISQFIKVGDFFLRGYAANGPTFEFNGLKWVDTDGEIYRVLFQTFQYRDDYVGEFYPVITVNDRTGSSSGRLYMIKKENRYLKTTDNDWCMYDFSERKEL